MPKQYRTSRNDSKRRCSRKRNRDMGFRSLPVFQACSMKRLAHTSHSGGRRFESARLHQVNQSCASGRGSAPAFFNTRGRSRLFRPWRGAVFCSAGRRPDRDPHYPAPGRRRFFRLLRIERIPCPLMPSLVRGEDHLADSPFYCVAQPFGPIIMTQSVRHSRCNVSRL